MYQPHPSFTPPEDENVRIWRYMDFIQFMQLLETGCLYFMRLSELVDRFEGALPMPSAQQVEALGMQINYSGIRPRLEHLNRNSCAVSCWHMNDYESAAMWGLYMKGDQGIAVRSTYKRLVDSFGRARQDVFVGCVKYIDYTRDTIDWGNTFGAALCKRKSFEHELELRAAVMVPLQPGQPAVDVPVDLSLLVCAVYVAPSASEWVVQVVRRVVERYGLSAAVIQSDLNKGPIY